MKKRKYTWSDYEAEKARLQKLNLPPDEYQRRIRELAERLGL